MELQDESGSTVLQVPRTFDTDYQSTVSVCVDMAPSGHPGTTDFGPYKNTSIIERSRVAYNAKSVCAKQGPRGSHVARE